MPGEHDEHEDLPGGEESADEAAAAAGDAISAALAQVPEAIRNTPEFQALAKEHRKTVRKLGSTERQLATARGEAERARIAAEAERQAALETQLSETLGEDGIAAFNELAELSSTDPVAAARRFKELMASAQSAPPANPAPGEPPTTPQGAAMSASVPPPPGGGVDGGQPLGPQATDEIEALTKPLDERYAATVARNLDPKTRNRVTMKERAAALIGYVGSAYIKAIGPERTRPGSR